MCAMILQVHLIHYVWTNRLNWFASIFWGIFNIIRGEISLCILFITVIIYAHACILLATFGLITTLIIILYLKQIQRLLFPRKKYSEMPSQLTYKSFLKHIIHIMQLFPIGNYTFGKAFFVYMVINCPINCVLIIILLNNQIDSIITIFFILMFVLHQLNCIFGFHIFVANANSKIHSPIKRMIYLYFHDRKFSSFTRLKLKVHNYIMAFHTKKKIWSNLWLDRIDYNVLFC